MNRERFIGLDEHQATISVAVLDCTGAGSQECIRETKAATIVEFFAGLRGTLSVTFEEATSATWLYDQLKPHVDELVGAIQARTHGSKMGARMTASMRASWRGYGVATSSNRSTAARRACGCCASWRGII